MKIIHQQAFVALERAIESGETLADAFAGEFNFVRFSQLGLQSSSEGV